MKKETIQPDIFPPVISSTGQVDRIDAEVLAEVGVLVEGEERSGTYILRDFQPVCALTEIDGLELLPIATALKKYDWLHRNYYWKAVPIDLDNVTDCVASQPEPQGVFIHIKKGYKISLPCQTAMYIASHNIAQKVHNIIIIEDDAGLELIAGCVTRRGVNRGIHWGVTEAYVGKNATLTNTMIHSWGHEIEVRSRAATIVEEGGTFVSNYISLRSAGDIQSNPKTWLNGRGASAKYLTIILGSKGSIIDIDGEIYLNAESTSAELTHRGISTGGSITQRGLLIGNANCRAHVDCAGMLLEARDDGFVQSNPGLKALHPEAQMSHEASIGKIAPEQVEYLQSRGMEKRDAISMIIRGFLDGDIEGLGFELNTRIAEIAEMAGHGEE